MKKKFPFHGKAGYQQSRGVTLIEALIAIGVMAILVVAGVLFINQNARAWNRQAISTALEDQLRAIEERITLDLRESYYVATGTIGSVSYLYFRWPETPTSYYKYENQTIYRSLNGGTPDPITTNNIASASFSLVGSPTPTAVSISINGFESKGTETNSKNMAFTVRLRNVGSTASSSTTSPTTTPTPTSTTQYQLTVTVTPIGSGAVTPADGLYSGTIQLSASANGIYDFVEWLGVNVVNEKSTPLVMDSAKNVTARFGVLPTVTTAEATGINSIAATMNGSVNANGEAAWVWFEWGVDTTYSDRTGNQDGGSGNTTIAFSDTVSGLSANTLYHYRAVAENKDLKSYGEDKTFSSMPQYSLTAIASPAGGGTVSLNPPGGNYNAGTVVELTASANSGYRFDSWSKAPIDGSTSNPVSITMDGDYTVTANFIRQYKLTATPSPSGGGTVSLLPQGGLYDEGTSVSLAASANSGYRFGSWSGDATGTVSPTSLVMNADKNVMANFIKQWTLTVSGSPSIGGSTAPATGTYTYDAGTTVTLAASANSGYRFGSWSGDATGTVSPTTLVMNADKNVTANFIRQYRLTVTPSPIGGGVVSLVPLGGLYDAGISVTLTASANSGYRFGSWSGDATGTVSPTTLVMNADKNVTANFIRQYRLTVTPSPLGGGTTDPQGTSIRDSGENVPLAAYASPGWGFTNWNGNATGTVSITLVLMDQNRDIYANFGHPPNVSTQAATSVTYNTIGATLNGTANANGLDTKVWFEWRTKTSTGASATVSIGSGTASIQVNVPVSSLTPTVYYFRAVAGNTAGTVSGEEYAFFASDFNSMDGLTPLAPTYGNWITNGGYLGPTKTGEQRIVYADPTWSNYEAITNVVLDSGDGYGIYFRGDGVSTITSYIFQFDPGAQYLAFRKITNGFEATAFQKMKFPETILNTLSQPHTIRLLVVGERIRLFIDNVPRFDFTDNFRSSGLLGYRSWDSTKARFDWTTARTLPADFTLPAPPSAPTNLIATKTSTNIVHLSWINTSSTADGFKIERSSDSNPSSSFWVEIALVGSGSTTFDTTTTPNTRYYYRVRAYNEGGDSSYSNITEQVVTPPLAPTNLTATPSSSSTIVLQWEASGSQTGFAVERKTGLASFAEVGTTTIWTYTSTGLAANTTYTFRVKAYGIGNGYSYSNEASATTLPNAPIITTAAATTVTQTIATLNGTVNPNGGAAWVWFEWGTTTTYTSSTPAQAIISGTSAVPFTAPLSGLSLNTTYYFRAVGQNTGGISYGDDLTYNTLPNLPIITTQAATTITQTIATLNGIVNPNGGVTWVWFEWGTTASYGNVTTPSINTGSGTTATSFSAIQDSLPNTTYHFRAVGQNAGGVSYGGDLTFTTLPNPPDPPSNLSATAAGTERISLSWTNTSSGVQGFQLERSLDGSSGWVQTATVGAGIAAHTDAGLQEGTPYFYRVRAFNAGGLSEYSNVAQATTWPAGPVGLQATSTSTTTISLSWTNTSSGVQGFQLERSLDGSSGWVQTATVGAGIANYIETGLSANTLYFYRIRAYNGGGASEYSNIANALTYPNPPLSLTGTAISTNSIRLDWIEGIGGQDSFGISRSDFIGPFPSIPGTTFTFTDTGLTASTTYTYQVWSANATGTSTEIAVSVKTMGIDTTPPWPMFHHDPSHSGLSTHGSVGDQGPITSPPTLGWSYAGSGEIYSTAAIGGNGTVYVQARGSSSGDSLLAFNSSSATPKWSLSLDTSTSGQRGYSSPVVSSNGTIFVGTANGVVAVRDNGTTATLLWRQATGILFASSPAISQNEGWLAIGAQDGKLYTFNTATGAFATMTVGNGGVDSSPAIGMDEAGKEVVYVGVGVSANGTTGTGFFLAAYPPTSTSSGVWTEKWRYDPNTTVDFFDSSPAIDADGTIYVGCGDKTLYAFNPNGSLKWRTATLGNGVHSSPALSTDGNTVYVGSSFGGTSSTRRLNAVSTSNGSVKWNFSLNAGQVVSSPAIGADGTIYIANYSRASNSKTTGRLYAVRDNSTFASLIWQYPNSTTTWSGGFWSSPTLSPDGSLYIGVYGTSSTRFIRIGGP